MKNDEKPVGGHESHGGRGDLGPADRPELPHAATKSDREFILEQFPWLKIEGQCENCKTAPATERWGGQHDSMSLARNPQLARPWCKRCVLVAQRDYMRSLVPKLDEVERSLELFDAISKAEGKPCTK